VASGLSAQVTPFKFAYRPHGRCLATVAEREAAAAAASGRLPLGIYHPKSGIYHLRYIPWYIQKREMVYIMVNTIYIYHGIYHYYHGIYHGYIPWYI
jgi:hypothetical protein